MLHTLKNENLEIEIDTPFENYNSSRFDWTGKIVGVKFQNTTLSTSERTDGQNENQFGKGFYNEFGIDTALGFDEADIGGWFHKIGVGLLRKEAPQYQCSKPYDIRPAKFETVVKANRILTSCKSEAINGYSYLLRKEIELHDSSFTIKYYLENTGERDILTNEYVHNFTAFNDPIGDNYILSFPFQLKPELFGETVNPELKIELGKDEIKFNGSPQQQFFFSNLSGGETVDAAWELINLQSKIAIKEIGSFQTRKVNLWGWRHVISPELFFEISVKPGKSTEWSRSYHVRSIT